MPTAMITARTLGAMPELLARELGERALANVFRESGLPMQLIDDRRFFIPQSSLKAFVTAGSRQLGERHLGLLAAPFLSARDYGLWGEYVMSGATLADALRRTFAALHFHSSYDRVEVTPSHDEVWFSYHFAEAYGEDYEEIAFVAAAIMLSVVRVYLGPRWRPRLIAFDIPKRREVSAIEQTFRCEVRLGARKVSFPLSREALTAARAVACDPRALTLADVARDRTGRAPHGLLEIVAEQIRVQIQESQPSLAKVALNLDKSPRKLQRELERHGLTFRRIANRLKLERAKELLAERDLSITQIAAELSYSSPANFARAFQSETQLRPRDYRVAHGEARRRVGAES